jgi:parvulin-like peptidyl-prolyl isomerase
MYVLPEMRKVSYMTFAKKDFAKDFQISEAEILAEYEKNKEQFKKPESRDFFHIVFEKPETAKEFLQKFNEAVSADKSRSKSAFLKLAKEMQNKDEKSVTLSKITQRDLIPEIAEPIFKLPVGDTSGVLQSPLGFHVFLLNAVNEAKPMSFAEVKEGIKQQLAQGRQEKVLQTKVSEIDDMLLTSNSLAKTAKKFGLKMSAKPVKIDQAGQNENGEQVAEIKALASFAQNAFAIKQGQTSKIFYAKNSDGFYALQVEEIQNSRERNLSEVKHQVIADLGKRNKNNALQELAKKVGEAVKQNPNEAAQIAKKFGVKFEKNREFPRVYYVNFQGRQLPYKSKFLDELFDLKIGETTSVLPEGSQEFMIGILRDVKKISATPEQFEQAKKQYAENFRTEILQEFNRFLLSQNPVKVNEKILGNKAE